MPIPFDLKTAQELATALLIGALVGIEREKRKSDDKEDSIGGLRTFVLFAAVGSIAGLITRELQTVWVLGATVLGVSGLVAAGYVMSARASEGKVGLTTEVAAIAVTLMGSLTTLGHSGVAVGLAVITAATLAYKQPLHGLVGKLDWADVLAGVRFLIAAFIVLPLLPDRTLDPWGALNPRSLWMLVLLISGLSLVGYVATRWLGAHKGTALTAITGGMVSSTAVTLSFARRSREQGSGKLAHSLACGILLAWTIMLVRVAIEVAAVNAALLRQLALPLAIVAVATIAMAAVFYRRSTAEQSQSEVDVPLRNPFSLTSAAKFVALFALVTLLVRFAQQRFPGTGEYFVAAIAGLTDVDAITLSMAEYARQGDPHVAARSILLAALSNTVLKCGLVAGLGSRELRRPILLGGGAIAAAAAAGIALA